MNKETTAILKLQGQARRILQVTDAAIKGKGIGEDVAIDKDTAHALNNITEEIVTVILESVPRPPKHPDPLAELQKALDEARIKYVKRVKHAENPKPMPIIDDLNSIIASHANAAVILQFLLDKVLDARIDDDTDAPLDTLTDKEKESLNFGLQQVLKTTEPYRRLIEGK